MKSRKQKARPVRAKRYQHKSTPALAYDFLEARQLLATDMLTAAVNFQGGGTDLIRFTDPVPLDSSAEVLRAHLELGENESLRLVKSFTDQLGWQHLKYQQYFNNIPVEGSNFTLHVNGTGVVSMSGDRVGVQNPLTSIELSGSQALQRALDYIGAEQYAWQDPYLSELVGYNGSAPAGELVYLTNINAHSVPTYKFDIYALDPGSRDFVYVNAISGEIELVSSRIREADVAANGNTHYNGNQNFTADSFVDGDGNNSFRLRQAVNGVETFDNNMGPIGSFGGATDIVSNLTVFNQPLNTSGVSAHWGAEQFLAYLMAEHGRDSYDDLGSPLVSFVNVSNNLVNAFWNGSVMQYGEGNNADIGPLVSLDIVGHEITHGVTEFSANLVYQNEPGALNESFSDIFGEALQDYAGIGADWIAGAEIFLQTGEGIRSYKDPNQFGDPDTYLGDFWFTGTGDNGGVHFNSGVQNKWFYILSEGEAGTNDNGDDYDVTGIGIQDAMAIAYRNLTVYLGVNSQYQDARDGAVQAAIDLFGRGSQQHLSTNQAWRAVGLVGEEVEIYDVQAIMPGSLIYKAQESSSVENTGPRLVLIPLEAGQKLTIQVTGKTTLVPTLEVMDPNGDVIATTTATSNVAVINSLPIDLAGSYTISVAGDNNSLGDFDIKLTLNAALETESIDGTFNGDLANAEDLNGTSYAIPGVGDRLGVIGEFGPLEAVPLSGNDFESGSLDSAWTTSSTDPLGRVFVTDEFGAAGGSFSLIMDQQNEGIFNLNEAIWSVDLTGVTTPILSFAYAEFDDENQPLPVTFSDSFDGDGVSVSADGKIWHTILTDTETAAGQWRPYAVNLADFAAQVGIPLNDQFQVKFQQYDDGLIGNDGRGFDEVRISNGESVDWYSFDAAAGESIQLAVQKQTLLGEVAVDLFDAAGNLVESTIDGLDVTSFANPYVSPGDATYFARLSGYSTSYSLVVTRGMDFDTGSQQAAPQKTSGNVLGGISVVATEKADADYASDKAILNTMFEGVVLSNDVTGGNVYAVTATQYTPPTGINVFGPGATQSNGWQEGVNEFRADFAIPQNKVSIDVGSGDTAGDVGFLRGYDISGVLIDEAVSASLAAGEFQTLTVRDPLGQIAYVIAAGVGSDVTPMDNLVYEVADPQQDFFGVQVTGGDSMTVSATFPGTDQFLFDNRLVSGTDINLRLDILDPSGNVIASGSDSVTFEAPVSGEYRIRVNSVAGEGDYILNLAFNADAQTPIGDLKFGIAAPDNATGRGYVMYSVESVHTRFGGRPHVNNADHLIAVRFNQAEQSWQYTDNIGWRNFTPIDSDRLMAKVDFSADTIEPLAQTSGRVHEIRQGYYDGNLQFQANVWNGAPNLGEFGVTGTYFTPRDTHVFVGDLGLGLPVRDQDSGTAYVMYAERNVFERFATSLPHHGNASHLIVTRFNTSSMTWQYSDNLAWIAFTPEAGDRLLAKLDLGADTVEMLAGVSSRYAGIEAGYLESDLVIIPNSFDGQTNAGEFEATGTFFRFNDLTRNIGDTGSGVAVADDATGTGFLMYSLENVFERFAGQPAAGNAEHFIAVRFDSTSNQWQFNNDAGWVSFAPAQGDVLVADLDFDADTVSVITDVGAYFGILHGVVGGDLAFAANEFGGGVDVGEFSVTGTTFSYENVTYNAGLLNRGIAVADNATGTGFIMYSMDNVHTRFGGAPNPFNANQFIAVRYDNTQGWQFNNNTNWVNFAIMDDDRLVASVDFDNDTVTSLLHHGGGLNGIGIGFVDSDLQFRADRWNGSANDGEFEVLGTYFTV